MASVRIFSRNLDEALALYTELLGFEVLEKWGPAVAILQRQDLQIWLSGPASSAAKPWADGTTPEPGGFTRIVLPASLLEASAGRLAECGARVVNGPIQGPGGTQTIVSDRDGNLIEFFG